LLTRIGKVTALAAAGLLVAAGPAMAHSDDGAIDNAKSTHGHDSGHQHGGDEGHLPAVDRNVDVIGQVELSNVVPGKIADVAVYGNYAYLAAWGGETCSANGVHVVDISDLSAPREIGFINSKEGSYPGEGVQVVPISTPAFTGDVLVTNNEICKGTAGVGGMNAYDVTDPAHPTPLMVGFGDTDGAINQKAAHEIHSVFAWDAGAKAYAVMVDNEETADVDIVDITDPKRPAVIAEYDLAKDFPTILQPDRGLDEVFLHDMVVKNIGGRFIMLASYWDGGYVQLDVTDPKRPKYLSDNDFAALDPEAAESGLSVPPEGNAHQAEYTLDNKYVIAADEDFSPLAVTAKNVTDGTDIDASQGDQTKPLQDGDTISGSSVFVGRACPGDPAVPAGGAGTQIAVVERGVCDFTVKVAAVEAAGGYEAILVFNRTAADACNAGLGMSVQGGLPTFGVAPREQGLAIFGLSYDDAACLAGDGTQQAPIPVGTVGDTLTFSAYFDGWGYVHLYDRKTMAEKDTYAIPEAHDRTYAAGFGDLSVHEVATSQVDSSLAYLSYYSGGLRVIKVGARGIQEVGAFIDTEGNNFWGVETFVRNGVEYVALSDRDHGLYIMKYTP
jgi:hypothetical protein